MTWNDRYLPRPLGNLEHDGLVDLIELAARRAIAAQHKVAPIEIEPMSIDWYRDNAVSPLHLHVTYKINNGGQERFYDFIPKFVLPD